MILFRFLYLPHITTLTCVDFAALQKKILCFKNKPLLGGTQFFMGNLFEGAEGASEQEVKKAVSLGKMA